jgi:C4-dicarboxylate-specific signal transduction histidine kinase
MEQTAKLEQNPTILVVGESPTEAKLLRQLLTAHGYRVRVASNGSDALRKVAVQLPRLVISDTEMSGMDGFELCRRVRALPEAQGTPVVLLTRLDDPADVPRSLEAGASCFISKPYSDRLLLSQLSSLLQGRWESLAKETEGASVIAYRDQSYRIAASRAEIMELLLATYQLAGEKSRELVCAEKSLAEMDRLLEQRVLERTAAVRRETAETLQAMEELRQKDEVLLQRSRQAAMGEMISNIAHQWRQPLNAVGLMVQDLNLSYEYGNLDKEYLDSSTQKIMKLVRHMSQTIDDFRNFFAVDREKRPFDVAAVARKTLSLVEARLTDRGIAVEMHAKGAPSITGQPNEFSQALLNIVSNAVDAFAERSAVPSPTLRVGVCSDNGKAVVSIEDNAGGIPEEIIDRVFEPYFTTKEQGKGTGIGLFMAKNIVEKSMNGSLSVRNTGSGAEFRIEV